MIDNVKIMPFITSRNNYKMMLVSKIVCSECRMLLFKRHEIKCYSKTAKSKIKHSQPNLHKHSKTKT